MAIPNYVLVSNADHNGILYYYTGFYSETPNGKAFPLNTPEYAKAMKIPYKDEAQHICDQINKQFESQMNQYNLSKPDKDKLLSPFTYHVEEHMYSLSNLPQPDPEPRWLGISGYADEV
jgi:hypothetical protein